MTRAEFTEAIVLAAGEVPKDPLLVESEEITSPFIDVPTGSKYFESING